MATMRKEWKGRPLKGNQVEYNSLSQSECMNRYALYTKNNGQLLPKYNITSVWLVGLDKRRLTAENLAVHENLNHVKT